MISQSVAGSNRIYLDYAAAAPLVSAAREAMQAGLEAVFGNPSAIHREGQTGRDLIDFARQMVAQALLVRPAQVTFVSGGTEANNSAVWSAISAAYKRGIPYHEMEVVTTAIEHPSLLAPFEWFATLGVTLRTVPVTDTGRIDLAVLRTTITPRTVLVTCAYINSEVGTIQPVRAISNIVREQAAGLNSKIWFHLDGAQAPYWVTCQWSSLGVDSLALDAGKCGGPLGSGMLVVERGLAVRSALFGGGQENGGRAGTEAVIQILGASAALAAAQKDWQACAKQVQFVRDTGLQLLQTALPQMVYNGDSGSERVANNINLSLPGLDTEFAVVALDAAGFAVSAKSACAGAGGGESRVVLTLTGDAARASSTLRITLGPDTTIADMTRLTAALTDHCTRMSTLTK